MIPYKQSYIHTCSPNVSKANHHYQYSIFNHTHNCLISLIHGMNSGSFGINTVKKSIDEISHFKSKYLQEDDVFYIDSGGYSIISGEVGITDIPKFIEMYISALKNIKGEYIDLGSNDIDVKFLKKERQVIDNSNLPDKYDFIFSLDIPFFIQSPSRNTAENIYNFNKESLSRSIIAIKENPILIDKFLFVLQWKMPKQFEVWDYLYNELEVYKYHKYFAIGGMVGLTSFVNLQFAPFIVPLYYQLFYYIKYSKGEYPFYSHLLGIYHKPFRFILYYMQAIFRQYFGGEDKAFITYDTINWSISALYKARSGLEFYAIENDKLVQYDSHNLPGELLDEVYLTEGCRQYYHRNLEAIENDDKLTDTSFLIPLNIRSQLSLDKFFESYIKKHDMVQILLQYDNFDAFKCNIRPVVNNMLQYPGITSNFTKSVLESCYIIHRMHQWLKNDGNDKDKILGHMKWFISQVNFPFDLE